MSNDYSGNGTIGIQAATLSEVTTGGGSTSILTGSVISQPATVNLTAEGTLDWAHWGLASGASFDHKAGVTHQISDITPLGVAPGSFNANPTYWATHSWSDGTPTASEAGSSSLAYVEGEGNGFELTVAADTIPKTLKLYVGAWFATGTLEASLSDGSAPAYITSLDNPTDTVSTRIVSIDFSAASAGQNLVIRFTLSNDYSGNGTIAIQAATLSE